MANQTADDRTLQTIRLPYERLEKLLAAVNTASNAARNSWVGFLGIQAYIFITIAGVSHTALLLNSNVKLPVVNTQLPLSSFFLFAPLVFLFAHFGFLLQHAMLGRKSDTFNRELDFLEAKMPKEDYHPYRNEIVSYFFSQAIVGPPPSLLYGAILHLMGWLSFAFFPLFLLLFFQIKFLPFHDAMTTWFHRIYILADLLILFLAYKISLNNVAADKHANYLNIRRISIRLFRYGKQILTPKRAASKGYTSLDAQIIKVKQYYKKVSWREATKNTLLYIPRFILRTIGSINLVFSAGIVLVFSICIATFPGECLPWWRFDQNGLKQCHFSHETWLASVWGTTIPPKNHQNYASIEKAELIYHQNRKVFVPTSWIFEKKQGSWLALDRNLNLTNKDFISNTKFPLKTVPEEPAISLRGRDFRHAILDGSDLHFVDFTGADLSFASLEKTNLHGSRFRGATLNNTNLEAAKLDNALLDKANFQGAYLGNASLQNANLSGSKMIASFLGRAKLQGANLTGANLQGAYLGAARLQGANLSEANLQGSKLANARLQGANLSYANLQGANMQKARLQAANLRFAKLQGVNFARAFLHGANLSQASLQYSQNIMSSNLKMTNLADVQIWFWPKADKSALSNLTKNAMLASATLLKDNHIYQNDLVTLRSMIKANPSLKERLMPTVEKLETLKNHKKNEKWDQHEDYQFWRKTLTPQVTPKKANAKQLEKFALDYSKTVAALACKDTTQKQWMIKSLLQQIKDNSFSLHSACLWQRLSAPDCKAGQKSIEQWPVLIEGLKEKISTTKNGQKTLKGCQK